MKTKLMNDLKEAMKNKDTLRKDTIQGIRASILKYEKDNQTEADNNKILELIQSEVKSLNKALPDYEKSGREDLIKELNEKINILKEYLPKQASEGEIYNAVIAMIDRGIERNIGALMKQAKAEFGSTADGKMISDIIKEILSK